MYVIKEAKAFVDAVANEPGGEKINECIQCGVCSGSCTTVEWWEYPPRKLIAMIRAGMKEQVLSSASAFNCVTCYLCTVRCPRDIKPSALMHAVMAIAEREGYKPKTPTLTLFRTLRESMKRGRIWDFGMAARFYFSSNIFNGFKVMPVALALISRGLMPIMPPKPIKSGEIKAILNKVRSIQGTGGKR
ncbi:MAG: 4Fe-4S dicluster domain-containing protein [Dehalococcoidia bacterium]|jgi:heterodisulfide reductase subunit C